MVGAGGKFFVQPQGTNVWCILIAHAMRHESVVRNGYKVFRGYATGSAKRESIFTNRSLALKSNVL